MKKLTIRLTSISNNIWNTIIEKTYNVTKGFFLFLPLLVFSGQVLFAQPVKPGNLYVLSRNGQNEVHWAKTGNAEMLEYRIYRSEDSVSFTLIGKVLSKDSTYYDNNLVNEKFYFYRVTAVNKSGKESVYSNTDASSPQKSLSNGLNFDGNGSCLVVEDNKVLNLKSINSFSFEFWIKFSDASPNGCIISRQNTGDVSSYYQLKISSGKFMFSLNGNILESGINSLPVVPNTWYHLACTYQFNSNPDLRPLNIYVNGQNVNTLINATGPKEETKNSMLIFGAEKDVTGNFTNGFNGQIKEIRLWNYALSQNEISERMNLPLRGDEPGMLGLWHCNGIFNKLVYDYSPNSDNAFVHGNIILTNSAGLPVNNAPVIVDAGNNHITTLSESVKAGTTKRICLKVTDKDGDSVSIIKASYLNRNGAVTFSGTCFNYKSTPDFSGTDPFLLVVADNGMPVMYDTVQVYMNVTISNTPPLILDSLGHHVNRLCAFTDQDSLKQIVLNVSDKEKDSTSIFCIRSLGNHCNTFVVPGKKLCFNLTPVGHFFGEDSLRVIVTDNGHPAMYDTVIIHINVIYRNRAPQTLNSLGFATNLIYKKIHNEPSETCLTIIDIDKDSTAISSAKSINGKGFITFAGKDNHCFLYIPNKNAMGEDTTMIIVSDNGKPSLTDTVRVIFTIVPVNTPPVIVDERNNHADTLKYSVNEGDPLEICIRVTDTNNDRDSIITLAQAHSNGAQYGTISNTCISYQPASGFIGMDELFIIIGDHGDPLMYDSVAILINVKPKLTIAHGISPDGDGVNDNWQIEGIEKYPNNTVTIFNQWGDILYKVSGYDNANVVWKGEARGGTAKMNGELPNGTYFYVIDISGARPMSGFLLIKR